MMQMKSLKYLGVNLDHIATLRQARGTLYPDPIAGAHEAQLGGADGITVHLREDRRHIQPRDVELLKEMLLIPLNLEIAATPAMIDFACRIRPAKCCLVPEKREELTTEGGLNVIHNQTAIAEAVTTLSNAGIEVSLFIEADNAQITAARDVGAPVIELHTGCYADKIDATTAAFELEKIRHGVEFAHQLGLIVNAGHGLHYHNVLPIAAIPMVKELNIGHAIIARSIHTGLERAVREMKQLLERATM